MTVGADAAAAGGDEATMPTEARSLAHLAECLGEGSLQVHGMPVVSLREGRVVGVEALARWRTRGGQVLRAEEFLPRVDEAGLWAELDVVGHRVHDWTRLMGVVPPMPWWVRSLL